MSLMSIKRERLLRRRSRKPLASALTVAKITYEVHSHVGGIRVRKGASATVVISIPELRALARSFYVMRYAGMPRARGGCSP